MASAKRKEMEPNVLIEQVVLEHHIFHLHEAPSRHGLVFQSHVSTCRLSVEWADSVEPSGSGKVQDVVVARTCCCCVMFGASSHQESSVR